jgi:hypothetical protein
MITLGLRETASAGGYKQLHNEGLCYLYSSAIIISDQTNQDGPKMHKNFRQLKKKIGFVEVRGKGL